MTERKGEASQSSVAGIIAAFLLGGAWLLIGMEIAAQMFRRGPLAGWSGSFIVVAGWAGWFVALRKNRQVFVAFVAGTATAVAPLALWVSLGIIGGLL